MRRSIRTVLASLFLSLSCFAADGTAPPEPISRIAFLGDSITAGVGVKTPKTDRYSTVATRLLQQRYPGITEINLGRSGQALCQQKPDYAEAEVLSQNPDAVVIQWGVNDQYWGYSVTEFTAKYEHLVSALRRAKPKMPIVLTTPVADFRWPENQDVWIGQAAVACALGQMEFRFQGSGWQAAHPALAAWHAAIQSRPSVAATAVRDDTPGGVAGDDSRSPFRFAEA